MSDGDLFSPYQRDDIQRAVREAERLSSRRFAVHVGPSDGDPRQAAEKMHAALPDPPNTVLIHVDPLVRDLQIVTGSAVRQQVTNRQAALAALTMQTAFAAGDLPRGILSGLQQLAEFVRPPVTLHTDTP